MRKIKKFLNILYSTPHKSVSPSLKISKIGKLTPDISQMVLGEHGDRHYINPPPQPALQRFLALLYFRDLICFKYLSIRCFYSYIRVEIYTPPWNFWGYDTTSSAVTFLRDFSYGTSYDHKYDSFCMCTCLGTLGCDLSKFYASPLPIFSILLHLTIYGH